MKFIKQEHDENNINYRYYLSKINIENKDFLVRSVIKTIDNNRYYDHKLTDINKERLNIPLDV